MAFDIRKWNVNDSLTSLELVFIQDLAADASYDSGNVALDSELGAGAGIGFETPSGTVDDSNVTFTVANVPLFIIINGVIYFENLGYTRSSLTLTLSFPAGTGSWIRSAYAA